MLLSNGWNGGLDWNSMRVLIVSCCCCCWDKGGGEDSPRKAKTSSQRSSKATAPDDGGGCYPFTEINPWSSRRFMGYWTVIPGQQGNLAKQISYVSTSNTCLEALINFCSWTVPFRRRAFPIHSGPFSQMESSQVILQVHCLSFNTHCQIRSPN